MELLGIIQSILSFLVMVSYIVRYHGKIFEEYLESYKTTQRERFSDVKGSLGFAFGSEAFKVEHATGLDKNKSLK